MDRSATGGNRNSATSGSSQPDERVQPESHMKESSQKAREPDKPGSKTARSQIARWIG